MRSEEFERLYADHASDLIGFLVYRTGDRALAEDIAADTFERVLRARRRFDPRRGSAKTWVYSIALNRLRDHLRRDQAEQRAIERVPAGGGGTDDGTQAIEAVASRDELLTALAGLASEEREAVALRFGGDLTIPEIAAVTGEKLTTVEGRVYRALRKLRERIDD